MGEIALGFTYRTFAATPDSLRCAFDRVWIRDDLPLPGGPSTKQLEKLCKSRSSCIQRAANLSVSCKCKGCENDDATEEHAHLPADAARLKKACTAVRASCAFMHSIDTPNAGGTAAPYEEAASRAGGCVTGQEADASRASLAFVEKVAHRQEEVERP